MYDSPFLQSYVAPICRFKNRGIVQIEQLHGTGFLIGSDGFFLTARHVLEKASLDIKEYGGEIGIFPLQVIGGETKSLNVRVIQYEVAPAPFDIAIFSTEYCASTPFRFVNRQIEVWQDVAAMGYPASVINKTIEQFQIQQRVHKGYIQRVVPAGRLKPGENPSCFELNFPVTKGLSGPSLR